MKLRFIHIIACLLLSLFASKEVVADIRLTHADKKEICADCTSQSEEQNQSAEERSPDQEQKLPADGMLIPVPVSNLIFNRTIYNAPYTPAFHPGVLTPPPKAV